MMHNTNHSIPLGAKLKQCACLALAGLIVVGLTAGCGHGSATGATAAPVTPATVAASVPPQMQAKVELQESQAQQVSEEIATHQAAMAAKRDKH